MKTKRIISLLLTVAMLVSCVAISLSTSAATTEVAQTAKVNYNEYEKMLEAIKPENHYGLADTVDEGKIIQAWNLQNRVSQLFRFLLQTNLKCQQKVLRFANLQ